MHLMHVHAHNTCSGVVLTCHFLIGEHWSLRLFPMRYCFPLGFCWIKGLVLVNFCDHMRDFRSQEKPVHGSVA